ncbi:MAG: discoidin domain-containing protein [Chloroflexota bacterium]
MPGATRLRFLSTALAVALAAGAAAGSPVTTASAADTVALAAAILPLASVLPVPEVMTPDPSGRAVTVTATTTIPLVCSVVLGAGSTFDRVVAGAMMGPEASTDHHLVIGGLAPATTYRYRLQGVGPDGTLYVGETGTFTTPAAPAAAGPDLRAGASIVGVSSEYSDAFAAALAIDGDPSTAWSSRGDGDDAWLEIDLGAPMAVDSVAWLTRSMTDGSAITETFAVIADGVALGTFATGPDGAPIGRTVRILRLEAETTTGGNTGATEILVLGPAAETTP